MDQDDSMMTSPSSPGDETYDEDNLFPENTTDHGDIPRPQTPQNDHLNAAAPGELSPPRSQSANQANTAVTMTTATTTARPRNTEVDDMDDMSPTAPNRTAVSSNDEEWKPGQGWKNKKAQEDMQRAWDSVVDKDFSLRDYGDVMAHRLTQ